MLDATPSILNSDSARSDRVSASSKFGVGEWAMTLASRESNAVDV